MLSPVSNPTFDQFMDETEISDEVLFLYDNSVTFTNVKDNQRYNNDSEILRWQVEKYKNGTIPGKIAEDFFAKNLPLKLNSIAGHLVESSLFSYN
jgi:hypothetical protein